MFRLPLRQIVSKASAMQATESRAAASRGKKFAESLVNQGVAHRFVESTVKSFLNEEALEQAVPSGSESLGVGSSIGGPPSGLYTTDYDTAMNPDVRSRLALPDTNDAGSLWRFTHQPGQIQYTGTAAPQGPSVEGSDRKVFSTDSPGGGYQEYNPVPPSFERVMKGQEYDSAGRIPFDDLA